MSLARTRAVAQSGPRENSGLLPMKILRCQQNAKQLDLEELRCVDVKLNVDLAILVGQQSSSFTNTKLVNFLGLLTPYLTIECNMDCIK